MMTVVQVRKKRMDVRRERRARGHAGGRLGPEPATATGAAPAQKLDPRGVRHDRRDVDMVLTLAHLLGLPGDVILGSVDIHFEVMTVTARCQLAA